MPRDTKWEIQHELVNCHNNYRKTAVTIIGISDIHVIAVNGSAFDPEKFEKSIEIAHQTIKGVLERELV